MSDELFDVVRQFRVQGDPVEIEPYGDGHINRTYKVETTQKTIFCNKFPPQLSKISKI
ncbi:hypothetical protein [Arcanobacterium hippocoleae]|uniref:hypothetical protein n=1 Tax=Arcanobacterium hippocoleae TaxID=149017 RepID=UPI00333E796D